ncbi:hypothetical protein FDH82_gp18 [Roseobacter phage RDJL Phi 2]|uniref:Uncharacterized protein n=1 Tax=Roseobacter phage RDJL Phi 2 TaxID=1682380 RepID=A0A0K0PWN2_9CAUD|nr:hypothetical protein FDH82_gp18 [Roseobacter phage RDJL Phi 2]AKQ75808.1 hypothetical protein RDJLphi2_gp18 [Roseobacter phage RDJL Phi 2]
MADEAKTEDKAPKRGVGTVAMEAIAAGKTNEEALEAVKAEFPDAKTSLASINWYRNKMRADDKSVPTARDLKKAAKAEDDAGDGDGEEAGDGEGDGNDDPLD